MRIYCFPSHYVFRALCSGGCNVNVRTARGETALHLAVTSRKTSDSMPELVSVLLDAGCNANIQDNLQGRTALHGLVRHLVDTTCTPCLETFRQVAQKSDVNLQDHRQRTALHRLAASGCTHLEAFQVSYVAYLWNAILNLWTRCCREREKFEIKIILSSRETETGTCDYIDIWCPYVKLVHLWYVHSLYRKFEETF
jgi:FOG: Ankyrin repeat